MNEFMNTETGMVCYGVLMVIAVPFGVCLIGKMIADILIMIDQIGEKDE